MSSVPSRPGHWRVPRTWDGATVAIVGGGPSLSLSPPNWALLQEKAKVIVVNVAFFVAPWADVLFFNDCAFWTTWIKDLRTFPGIIVTTCKNHARSSNGPKVLYRVKDAQGISRDPETLRWNGSSGACAIGLARHFGAKKIVLLGMDMKPTESPGVVPRGVAVGDKARVTIPSPDNFHSLYPPRDNPRKPHAPFPYFLSFFPAIARDLADEGIECVNATPGSALEQFPKVSLEEALA